MRCMKALHSTMSIGILLAALSQVLVFACKPAHELEYPYGVRPVETELAQPTEEAPPPSMEELRELLDSQEKLKQPVSSNETATVEAQPPKPEGSGSSAPEASEKEPSTNQSVDASKEATKAPGEIAVGEEVSARVAPVIRPQKRNFHDFRGEWIRGKNEHGAQAWLFKRTGFFDCREDRHDGVRIERTGTWQVSEPDSRITLSFNEWRHSPDPTSGKILRKLSTGHTSAVSYAIEEGALRIDGVVLAASAPDLVESP